MGRAAAKLHAVRCQLTFDVCGTKGLLLGQTFGAMDATNNRPVWYLLTLHWVSLAGCAIVTTAVLSFLFVLPLQMRGQVDNPYIGIIVFLILPVVFFAGLLLVPIGIYLGKRRLQKGLVPPEFDRKATLRRLVWFFGITTLANIIIG